MGSSWAGLLTVPAVARWGDRPQLGRGISRIELPFPYFLSYTLPPCLNFKLMSYMVCFSSKSKIWRMIMSQRTPDSINRREFLKWLLGLGGAAAAGYLIRMLGEKRAPTAAPTPTQQQTTAIANPGWWIKERYRTMRGYKRNRNVVALTTLLGAHAGYFDYSKPHGAESNAVRPYPHPTANNRDC